MQNEINEMISGGLIAIAEHGVVEKIRKRSKGPIQTGFPGGPPIGVFKDEGDVFGSDFANAWINKQALIVEDEAGLKRIRKRQQGERPQPKDYPQVTRIDMGRT